MERWVFLYAASNLLTVRHGMLDARDRATVLDQLRSIAPSATEAAGRGMQTAADVSTQTARPGIALEASRIGDFFGETKLTFEACGGGPP